MLNMKNIFVVVSILLVAAISLMLVSLHRTSFQDFIICSTNDEASYIPVKLCQSYLYNFRGNAEDIHELEQTTGVTIAFDVEDQTQRRALFEFLLSKGMDINKQNLLTGLYPIHELILRNDVKAIKLLLQHGADINLEDSHYQKNALEFTQLLIQTKPEIERKQIVLMLQERN